jgi:hypothetical protein
MLIMISNSVTVIVIIVKVLTTTVCMRIKPRLANCGISLTNG